MTVIPVSALEYSMAELCRILADSFNESSTPFALPPDMFASRFISEGLSLEDSCVWLVNGNPAAIAIVTRRMDKARLAAFGVLPEYRSQGLAKQMLTPLFISLKDKKIIQREAGSVARKHPRRRSLSRTRLSGSPTPAQIPGKSTIPP
ncbi:GNAT family N-acetyltransferase [Klebsiella pneumoniae]|uniref:GNAT family N-acetyltransferase n=1 Tax=Klebsiella pneumoniae TaxID=573 RepID=UPI00203C4FD3|nr:GNAT family N-acetyltransferase [Klebsiella pneumoniae]